MLRPWQTSGGLVRPGYARCRDGTACNGLPRLLRLEWRRWADCRMSGPRICGIAPGSGPRGTTVSPVARNAVWRLGARIEGRGVARPGRGGHRSEVRGRMSRPRRPRGTRRGADAFHTWSLGEDIAGCEPYGARRGGVPRIPLDPGCGWLPASPTSGSGQRPGRRCRAEPL